MDEAEARLHLRAVWVSDLHLGSRGCQAEALLDFLRNMRCETLYLVGDVIDGWQLRQRWHWPRAHEEVVQRILMKVRAGTRVIFIPGNHDAFARGYASQRIAGVEIFEDFIHVTADGKRLWVTHGDAFDGAVHTTRLLLAIGDFAHSIALRVNRRLNAARLRVGLPYWSLSRYLKLRIQRVTRYIADFERAAVRATQRRGLDGVVCGHIHHAEMRTIDGILYCNDGDWVESLTALVEHGDGRLELLNCSHRTVPIAEPLPETPPAWGDATP
jgi:UDP-2,3-diacylglucosamine pyrophosphatase LpxH